MVVLVVVVVAVVLGVVGVLVVAVVVVAPAVVMVSIAPGLIVRSRGRGIRDVRGGVEWDLGLGMIMIVM